MSQRVRIFLDFWNFQLTWNERTSKARCDWPRLAPLLNDSCAVLLGPRSTDLDLLETRIYASVSEREGEDQRLKRWLDEYLNRLPGYNVQVRVREKRRLHVRCRNCGLEPVICQCGATLTKSIEKGVDTAIVTDMLGLAWEGAYDIAILVSSDGDFVPAVEHIQRKGLRIVNACWSGQGHNLAKNCWASLSLDELVPGLRRTWAQASPEVGPDVEGPSDPSPVSDAAVPGDLAAFVAEANRAREHFKAKGGFLGASYFVSRWTSPAIPPPGDERQRLLEEAVRRGLLELTDVKDSQGKPTKAIGPGSGRAEA